MCRKVKLDVRKSVGKVKILADRVKTDKELLGATVAVGHTRWATHGGPSDVNAHPHESHDGSFALVHNGIIENFYELKANLKNLGYTMKSETDTEVLVCLIESLKKQLNCPLEEAVRLALHEVIGAYAIVVISSEDPNVMIGARKGSPLVLGIGEKECFLASDAAPFVGHTTNVVYFEVGIQEWSPDMY